MSRTAINGFGLFIVRQIAIVALILCLCAQKGYAQTPIYITPTMVGGGIYTGTIVTPYGTDASGDLYYMAGDPNTWHLQLGSQFQRGGIRVRNTMGTVGGAVISPATLRFDGTERVVSPWQNPLLGDGGAIYIHEGQRYDFSAAYAHTAPGAPGTYMPRSRLVFENNVTTGSGGAVSITRTEVNFTNAEFYNNHTVALGENILTSGGGAIHNVGGNITFTDTGFGNRIVSEHNFTGSTDTAVSAFPRLRNVMRPAESGTNSLINSRGEEIPPVAVNTLLRDIIPGELAMKWVTTLGNTTVMSGGAIHSSGGTLTFNANATVSISSSTNPNATGAGADNGNPVGNPAYIPGVTVVGNTRRQIQNYSDFDRYYSQPWSDSTVTAVAGIADGNPGNAWFDQIFLTQSANTFIGNSAGELGGAIYGSATDMDFTARAVASATATSGAAATTATTGDGQIVQHADGYVETVVNTFGYGGYFQDNVAGRSGGAIYTQFSTLNFEARDTSATASATATASAASQGTNFLGQATSEALANAYADARAGYFVGNTALGTRSIMLGDTVNDGGGAIFNRDGTINFTVHAVNSSAISSSTANAATSGTGGTARGNTASAAAMANAWAHAYGGYFEDNWATHGGAIYNTGTLNFNATSSISATSEASATANNSTAGGGGGTWAATASSWANYGHYYYGGAPPTVYGDPVTPYFGYLYFSRAFGGYFVRNEARLGGAIFNDGGTLRAETFPGVGETWHTGTGGASGGSGGGAWTAGATVTEAAAIVFDHNRATIDQSITTTVFGGHGGAIYNLGGTLEFLGYFRFQRNIAEQDGGAIYNDGGTVTVSAGGNWVPTITQNFAQRDGGAFYNTNEGTITMQYGWFSQNGLQYDYDTSFGLWYFAGFTLTDRGGAIFNDEGTLNLGLLYSTSNGGMDSGVRFVSNSALETGGAIHNTKDGIVNLLGVNFDYNIAYQDGGAIYNEGGVLNVEGGRNPDGTPWRRPDGGFYSLFAYNGVQSPSVFGGAASVTVTDRGGAIFNTWDIATDPNTGDPILDPETGEPIILSGTLTVDNTRFEYNRVLDSGGALYNTEHAVFDLTDVEFVLNAAGLQGGAIWNAGTGTITDALFEQNYDPVALGTEGGAIYNAPTGILTFTNATFINNRVSEAFTSGSAEGAGGAIYNDGGTLIFVGTDSNFYANRAFYGGAIYNKGAVLTMDGSVFGTVGDISGTAGGNAARFGGAIYSTHGLDDEGDVVVGVVDLTNVLFQGNQATMVGSSLGSGGAFYNDGGLATLNTITFDRNTAYLHGGAIYNTNAIAGGDTLVGTLTLTDVDFIGNTASTGRGGAIYNASGRIDLNVTAGATSTFQNNMASGQNESIFFAGAGNIFNVNIGAGGTLNMFDPMSGEAGVSVNITKGSRDIIDPETGDVIDTIESLGTWALAGDNDFSAGTARFAVESGTLHLLRHNFGTSTVPVIVHTSLQLGAAGSFELDDSATLIIDGALLDIAGNLFPSPGVSIAANTIDLQEGTLQFNLSAADIHHTIAGGATLTLDSSNITIDGDVYVYLSGTPDLDLDGAPTAAERWFALAGETGGWFETEYATDEFNELTLIDTVQSNTPASIAVGAVYRPGSIAGTWEQYFAERENGEVRAFVINDGVLKLSAISAIGTEIYWTGEIDDVWDSTTANWFGYTPNGGGGIARTFWTGDNVRFANDSPNPAGIDLPPLPVPVANRHVNVGDSKWTVASMDVTGSDYQFYFEHGASITATGTSNFIDLGSSTLWFDMSGSFDSTSGNVVSGSLLTLTSNTIRTNPDENGVDPSSRRTTQTREELLDLLMSSNLGVGQSIAVIQASSAIAGINDTVRDVNNNIFRTQRTSNGNVYQFNLAGNNLVLARIASTLPGETIRWTGGTNGTWDSTTENWLGFYDNGTLLENRTHTFGTGDYVIFAEFFNNENEPSVPQRVTQTQVTLAENVSVFGMYVEDSRYVFNLGGYSIDAAYDITFSAAARVNMGAGSSMTAIEYIDFDEGAVIGLTGAATITAGKGILFHGDNNFHFDLSGAQDGDRFLTLEGGVVGTVGGGLIYINNLAGLPSLEAGDSILLVEIIGTGTVTSDGRLMHENGTAYQQIRNAAGGTMLGLKTENNDKELWLTVADASALAELHWTGVNINETENSVWSTVQTNTNWFGWTTEGVTVHTFLHGDRVFFGDVDNKQVNVASGGVTVADMTVTGTGYTFDLALGGITADADASTLTGATGNIDFGNGTTITAASNRNISASGVINFGNGTTITAGNAMTIDAGGDINFGDDTNISAGRDMTLSAEGNIEFGDRTEIAIGHGSHIDARGIDNAGGSITFGADTEFHFDLTDVTARDTHSAANTILTLSGDVNTDSSGAIGSGGIYVSNQPTGNVQAGRFIVLVDTETSGSTANTGNLFIGTSDTPHRAQRSASGGTTMFGLATDGDNSQLLLKWVDAAANSQDLHWTGTDPTDNLYIWSTPDSTHDYANWEGMVDGIRVDTFLHGDTVWFGDAAENRTVTIAEGGVNVDSMFVTASGYTFELVEGGNIVATGDVDLQDATVVVGVNYDPNEHTIVADQVVAEGTITVNGSTVNAIAPTDGEFAEIIRQLGGTVDVDILVAGEEIVDGGNGVGLNMESSAFYDAEFFIDSTTRRTGTLRLSYFLFETVGWNHNTTEAGGALDTVRHIWTDAEAQERIEWAGRNRRTALDMLRGTELAADSLTIAMWRPWEITHQRTRNVLEESGWNSWGGGYYRFGTASTDNNAIKYDTRRMGTMIGADYGANRYWQFGGAFGYAMPNIESAHGKVEAEDWTLGMYSQVNIFDQAWISSFFGYGYQSYRMTRLGFPNPSSGVRDLHESKYSGDALYASVEFVKPITVSIITAMPLVAIDHQTVWTKGFSESGRWGQTVMGTSVERTKVRFGMDSKVAGISGGNTRVDFGTRCQVAFLVLGDKRATVVTHFPMSGASMSLRGNDMGWGQINVGFTSSGDYNGKYQWFLDLDAFAADRATSLQAQFGLSTRF